MERWLIIFFAFVGIGLLMYGIHSYLTLEDTQDQKKTAKDARKVAIETKEQQEYIVKRIDNLSQEREAELQAQKIAILNNMTHLIVKNGELLIQLLHQHDKNMSVEEFEDNYHNASNTNMSGKISSFLAGPEIINITG